MKVFPHYNINHLYNQDIQSKVHKTLESFWSMCSHVFKIEDVNLPVSVENYFLCFKMLLQYYFTSLNLKVATGGQQLALS